MLKRVIYEVIFIFPLQQQCVFSMNIRSINSNFDELILMLSCMNITFNVIVLNEIWLAVSFINSSREINKNDEVTIYVKYNF